MANILIGGELPHNDSAGRRILPRGPRPSRYYSRSAGHGWLLVALCLLLLATTPMTVGANASGRYRYRVIGRVIDRLGAPLAFAQVRVAVCPQPIESETAASTDMSANTAVAYVTGTDSQGRFTLSWESNLARQDGEMVVLSREVSALETVEITGISFPSQSSEAPLNYARNEVHLSGNSDLDLGDVPVQIYVTELLVELEGTSAESRHDRGPAADSGLSLRVKDAGGDIVGRERIQAGALREDGGSISVTLPEGKWSIEVSQKGRGVWSTAAPIAVEGSEQTVRLRWAGMGQPVATPQLDVMSLDASSAKKELTRLGIPCSVGSLIQRIEAQNARAVALLLRAGVSPNVQDPDRLYTALMLAAEEGDPVTMGELIAAGADVNAAVPELGGGTALDVATFQEKSEVVEMLLAAGADVNAADLHGTTPLMFACSLGRLASVGVLLAHGADPNRESKDHRTALSIAERKAEKGIIDLLRCAGATR